MIKIMSRMIDNKFKKVIENNNSIYGLQTAIISFSLNTSYAFILYDLFKNDINRIPPFLMIISLLVFLIFLHDLLWLYIKSNTDELIDFGHFPKLGFETDDEYFCRKYDKVTRVIDEIDRVILVHKFAVYPLFILNVLLTIYGVMT